MTITASFKRHPRKDIFVIKQIFKDGESLNINWSHDQLSDLKVMHDIDISQQLRELCENNLELQGIDLSEDEWEELYSIIEVTERLM